MNYQEYLKTAILRNEENPNWRWGQTLFNVLFEFRPDLAQEIRGGEIDPYHAQTNNGGDKKITNFLDWVKNNWEPEFNEGSKQPNILNLAYWTIEENPKFDSNYFLEDCQKPKFVFK